jgi:hypothetical protein
LRVVSIGGDEESWIDGKGCWLPDNSFFSVDVEFCRVEIDCVVVITYHGIDIGW